MANTNLRDLLGFVTSDSLEGLSAPDATTKLARLPSAGYCVQYIVGACGSTCSEHVTSYNYYRYPLWCIPNGVCDVIFELWGAGGGGGSSCCCSRGIPSGSGAYAWKRVTGAASSLQGCSYDVNVGRPGCGRTGSQCGNPGGDSYITGFGLSNFCAKGGHGGCSCCFLCCCTWNAQSLSSCPYGCCVTYHGADGGAYGVPGAGYVFCYSNHCWNKQHVTYPAGLVNGKGGWMTAVTCENSGCGHCMLHWASAQLGWGGSFSDHNYVPGVGGPSGWTCGGGCCRGENGTAGMIRINFKYDENL